MGLPEVLALQEPAATSLEEADASPKVAVASPETAE